MEQGARIEWYPKKEKRDETMEWRCKVLVVVRSLLANVCRDVPELYTRQGNL